MPFLPLTLTMLGLVKTSLRMLISERRARVSMRKSLCRVEICIRHTNPWNVRYEWCCTHTHTHTHTYTHTHTHTHHPHQQAGVTSSSYITLSTIHTTIHPSFIQSFTPPSIIHLPIHQFINPFINQFMHLNSCMSATATTTTLDASTSLPHSLVYILGLCNVPDVFWVCVLCLMYRAYSLDLCDVPDV